MFGAVPDRFHLSRDGCRALPTSTPVFSKAPSCRDVRGDSRRVSRLQWLARFSASVLMRATIAA
eukprot:8654761-Pyramimonas_sp.AAC.1